MNTSFEIDRLNEYANHWIYPHSVRTFALKDTSVLRVFYYNVTYSCNSQCIFCASFTPNRPNHFLTKDQILETFVNFQVGAGDAVVLNGGEATLHRELVQVVRTVHRRGGQVILFTNGRLLARERFTQELLDAGISRVTIPLYSTSPEKHNALTGARNGFEQTLRGVHNLLNIREKASYTMDLELKCLSIKPCLQENPELVVFISAILGIPDRFVIGGVIPSQRVKSQPERLIPAWDELQASVNQTMRQAKLAMFPLVNLPDIPLCMLDADTLAYFVQQSTSRTATNVLRKLESFLYFDSLYPKGCTPQSEHTKPGVCRGCRLFHVCDADSELISCIDPEYANLVASNESAPY